MMRRAIVFAVVMAAGAAVAAGSYSLTSDGYNYGWANAYYWADASGTRSGSDGDPLDPTADYTMSGDLKTPSADGGDYEFGGNSLIMTGSSRLFVYTYGRARLLFPRDGLVIRSSGASKFNATSGTTYTLAGNLTVDVADHVFRSEYDNPTFVFEGSFHGESGTRLRIANKATKVILSSDLSDFAGTVALWVAGSRLEVAKNTTSGAIYFNGASTLAVSNKVSVGSLTMPANSTLEIGGWYQQDEGGLVTAGETGYMVVTDTLSLAKPINVLVKDSARLPNTARIPILTAPAGFDLKADDFNVSAAAFTDPSLTVETDDASGAKTLYLAYAPTIEPIVITNQVTVDSLSLLPGARLVIGGKGVKTGDALTGWESGCLTVMDSISLGGAVDLVVREDALVPVFPGETPESMCIPLLTVPEAAELDVNAFSLTAEAFAGAVLSIVPDASAGTKSLCLTYEPTVVLTVSDTNNQNFNLDYTSSWMDGAHWSNGEAPKAGLHYLVRTAAVASPGADATEEHTVFLRTPGGSSKGAYSQTTFSGDTLTVGRGCCLTVMDSYTYFRDGRKLRLLDGSAIRNGQGMEPHIVGPVEMPSGEVTVGTWCECQFFFDQAVSGAAKIRCRGAISNTGSAGGTTVFNGDLSAFSGTVEVKQFYGNKYGSPVVRISASGYAASALPEPDPAAVSLGTQAKLVVAGDVALADGSNRGLLVGDASGVTVEVADGKSLEIATRLTMADGGSLVKSGTGTLELGGDVRFGAEGSVEPADGVSYALSVSAGTLAVSGAEACDGLSLSFADGASLVLKYDPDNAALVASGIRNVKSATPFALSGSQTALPLAVDFPDGLSTTMHRVALVTVSSDAADAVRGLLAGVGVCCRGFTYKPWEEMGDGTVTFGGTLKPSGMVVSIR